MATLLFQCIIDCWGTHSDSGAILSCNVVGTHGFSSHNNVTKKVNKQAQGKIKNFKLSLIRDQRAKKARKQENSQKVVKQGRSLIYT